MDKIVEFLNKVPDWLQPIGYSVAVIALICAGIMYQTGQEGMSKAKKMILGICVGIALIALAASIVTSLKGAAE